MNTRVLFVTGATGAAGGAILERLVATGAFRRIVALVRGAAPAPLPGMTAIRGDITLDRLGLDPVAAAELAGEVTDVVHMAALTRFNAPAGSLDAVNGAGVERLLAFARGCPKLDRLLAFSTVYVAGRRTGLVREDELEHDAGFVNAYECSKYAGEIRLRAAMATLPISVVRLSTVIGRAADGAVAVPGAIHHALRFYYQSLAPMLPGTPSSPVDLIPIEYAADAAAALLVHAFAPGATWHVAAAADAPALEVFLDLTLDAFRRFRPSWRRRQIEKPAIVSLPTFERFAESVEALSDSVLSRSVAMVRPFAPQLAYPKLFDDRVARAALESRGVARPAFETYYPAIVKHLIDAHWVPAEEAAS